MLEKANALTITEIRAASGQVKYSFWWLCRLGLLKVGYWFVVVPLRLDSTDEVERTSHRSNAHFARCWAKPQIWISTRWPSVIYHQFSLSCRASCAFQEDGS